MPYTSSLNLYRGRLKRSGEGEAQQSTLTALEEWSHGDSSQEHCGCWESSDSLGQLHGSTSAAQRCCPCAASLGQKLRAESEATLEETILLSGYFCGM